ncbi:MAG: hypothetical protein NC110_03495 [Ruminococcus sp.]|nr:hypothetical protein [Ruminococcus sp.]
MSTFAEKNWGDCSKAVAYELNFVQMCYTSGSCRWQDYYEVLCDECDEMIQSKDFVYPKGSFSKKDYYILDFYCFGVSEKLKNEMIAFGIPEEVFRPIYASRGNLVLGYQIVPKNELPSAYDENGYEVTHKCKKCGRAVHEIKEDLYSIAAYGGLGYPTYLTEEALAKMQSVNSLNNGDVIISLELYNHLLKKYPRLECRPVFLGSVYDDSEYLKRHKPKSKTARLIEEKLNNRK